jgi:polyisoprenoid-binding protein YceI
MFMKKIFFALAVATVLIAAAMPQVQQANSINGESFVIYRMVHPFHKIEAKSKDVVYAASLDKSTKTINSVTAHVDVMTFDSGNSNRDSHAMEVIDALSFPDVTFSSTAIAAHGDSLTVTGKLTFHGVTRNIVASGNSTWSSNKLLVNAAFPISLTDFKVERPSLLGVPVEDTLRFSLAAAFPL